MRDGIFKQAWLSILLLGLAPLSAYANTSHVSGRAELQLVDYQVAQDGNGDNNGPSPNSDQNAGPGDQGMAPGDPNAGSNDQNGSPGDQNQAPVDQYAGPNDQAQAPGPQTGPSADSNPGPVRMARFSYLQGDVSWRPSESEQWSPASMNLPIRQSAEVSVTNGSRAEIQFDDGAVLRLGSNAVATLQTLYSDSTGEFTEVRLTAGLAALETRHGQSIYQIDAPFASVITDSESNIRIGVDEGLEVAVHAGSATMQSSQGKQTLNSGQYAYLEGSDAQVQLSAIPEADSWDLWNQARDADLSDPDTTQYCPQGVAIVAGDLGEYGDWREDPNYGHVWCPRVSDDDWRPYEYGHWVWCDPFGWTWVSTEDWGWAPYHYGTWIHASYGWGWCPGPERQYWCPGVVSFSNYDGNICWAPLCPSEVRYPVSLGIGFGGRGWGAFFSIGGCASYYPGDGGYCIARPWRNGYVNHVAFDINFSSASNSRNVYFNNHFVPINARRYAGVTSVREADFGSAARYQRLALASGSDAFTRGRQYSAPEGAHSFSGPGDIRPTSISRTTSRSFLPISRTEGLPLSRPVFRAALPASVARVAPPIASRSSTGRVTYQPYAESNPADNSYSSSPAGTSSHQTFIRPETLDQGDSAAVRAQQARQSLGYNPATTNRETPDASRSYQTYGMTRPNVYSGSNEPGSTGSRSNTYSGNSNRSYGGSYSQRTIDPGQGYARSQGGYNVNEQGGQRSYSHSNSSGSGSRGSGGTHGSGSHSSSDNNKH